MRTLWRPLWPMGSELPAPGASAASSWLLMSSTWTTMVYSPMCLPGLADGLPISWPVLAGSCPSLSPSPSVTQQTSTLINPPLPNSSCISMNCLLFRPLWKFWNSTGASQASEAILTPTYLHMSIWIFLLCGIRYYLRANISNQYWNKRTVLAYAGLSRKAGLLSKLLLMKPLCVLCKSMVILTLFKDPYVFVLLTWHSHDKM